MTYCCLLIQAFCTFDFEMLNLSTKTYVENVGGEKVSKTLGGSRERRVET